MNTTEYLIAMVEEEALEIAHRASKALRFGLDEVQPGQDKTNAERMVNEYIQLNATLGMLQAHLSMALIPSAKEQQPIVDAKIAKVFQFMEYSRQLGTLVDGPQPDAYPLLRKLAQATLDAHESMFAQCCSNPIMNSWGNKVDTSALNDAAEIARDVLKT